MHSVCLSSLFLKTWLPARDSHRMIISDRLASAERTMLKRAGQLGPMARSFLSLGQFD